MHHLSSKIHELEVRTNSLMEQHKLLLSAYQRLKNAYNQRIETINQQKALIEKLESDHKTNHSVQTLEETNTDQIKTKQIINEMMREIDHCLLLLDK